MYFQNEKSGNKSSIHSIVIKVLLRGEFRLIPSIMLLTAYGAAILAVPIVLNSVFPISVSYLGLQGNNALQQLLLSLHSEVIRSYLYVETVLFTGFVVTCLLVGMAIGRRTRTAMSLLSHLGVGKKAIRWTIYQALFLVCFVSIGLAFSVSIVLSSASLYVVSLLFAIPYSIVSVDAGTLAYILALLAFAFASLLLGWTRTSQKA